MIANPTPPRLAFTKFWVRRTGPGLREHRVRVLTGFLVVYTGLAWLATLINHALPTLERP